MADSRKNYKEITLSDEEKDVENYLSEKEKKEVLTKYNGNKFHRRQDLPFDARLLIAFTAMFSRKWEIITELSKKYAISRTFVYMLEYQLYQCVEPVFSQPNPINKHELVIEAKKDAVRNTIVFRLEGKCSIPAISDILKRLGLPNNSVGSISQMLNEIGSNLSSTIKIEGNSHLYVYLASDELFSHCRPILISVDPISTAILRIDLAETRQTSQWLKHFNELKAKGIKIIKVISDEGTSLCSATKLASITRQPDTFHAIAHRLGKWVKSKEKSAYSAILEEYRCMAVFESAKSEQVMLKRIEQYFQAKKRREQAISLYEIFKFLYDCAIN